MISLKRRVGRTEGALLNLCNSLPAQDMYFGAMSARMDEMDLMISDGRRAFKITNEEYTREIIRLTEKRGQELDDYKLTHDREMNAIKDKQSNDREEICELKNKVDELMQLFASMQQQIQQQNSTHI